MFLTVLLSLLACGNPCQQLCTQLADYAEECGLSVTNEDIRACEESQSGPLEKEDAQLCRDLTDPDDIREWWTCDDLAENFTDGSGG